MGWKQFTGGGIYGKHTCGAKLNAINALEVPPK
jgi:hypothetical protein